MLYTLAYPTISTEDERSIEAFRGCHDLPYVDVVKAHFTLVFGVDAIEYDCFRRHVEGVASTCSSIEFRCRYAMLVKDHEQEIYHIFLIPDEGNSEILRIHDKLYQGPLKPHLRLDIPFIPHITIATLTDPADAKQLCNELNENGVSIAGSIDRLTISLLDGKQIEDLVNIELLR